MMCSNYIYIYTTPSRPYTHAVAIARPSPTHTSLKSRPRKRRGDEHGAPPEAAEASNLTIPAPHEPYPPPRPKKAAAAGPTRAHGRSTTDRFDVEKRAKKVPNAASYRGHTAACARPLLRSEARPYNREAMCVSGGGVRQGAGAPAGRAARIWPDRPRERPARGRGARDKEGERGKQRTCARGCGRSCPVSGGMRRLRSQIVVVVDRTRASHNQFESRRR